MKPLTVDPRKRTARLPREAPAVRRLPLDAPAPPFDRNPSGWRQRVPVALLALAATGISVYMGLYQWGVTDSVWDPLFGSGTETVLRSRESEIMGGILGVPDAMFGAWAYLTEVVLSLAGSTRRWQFRPWLVLLFGLDVIPLGFVSVALVVVQGVSVGAWCFLCLVTAAISLVLVALVYDEVWASIRFLRSVWEKERDASLLWNVFWGRGSPRAYALALDLDRSVGRRPRVRTGR